MYSIFSGSIDAACTYIVLCASLTIILPRRGNTKNIGGDVVLIDHRLFVHAQTMNRGLTMVCFLVRKVFQLQCSSTNDHRYYICSLSPLIHNIQNTKHTWSPHTIMYHLVLLHNEDSMCTHLLLLFLIT